MSINIQWESLTSGPDGEALAETIRAFIHDRFQQVTLPRFIRSVKVHSFDFGTVAPVLELKDVCDPLPDFYDDEEDVDANEDGLSTLAEGGDEHDIDDIEQRRKKPAHQDVYSKDAFKTQAPSEQPPPRPSINTRIPAMHPTSSGFNAPTAYTPGIPGGTSNLGYFHLPLGAGRSGTATPLAAVAGAQFLGGWPDHTLLSRYQNSERAASSLPPTSSATKPRMPESGHDDEHDAHSQISSSPNEKSVNDVQIVTRLKYAGDVKLSLTADILIDYPMPSFVGIPLKLNVTGMTFDGVAIVAYIKTKAHFCFLSPEDADALIGGDVDLDMTVDERQLDGQQSSGSRRAVGGLFEEIKVESEIGQRMNGKQVLKNVGKVEKFVLEQVRRIFEDEFVYPSFWTFLV